ncbi:MAG: Uma2 family endonuclease [Anaerolineae bacterium]|nr:Uma2 family endonuclease [Anaerolineae bacterium]
MMVAARHPFIPLDHYLAKERRANEKHEYFDGLVYMMAGASERHVKIVSNIVRALGNQLADRPCSTYSTDLRVKTPSGLVAYPDVMVVCGQPELYDDKGDVLLNPSVIVEVLSPSTEAYDRTMKFEHYQSIPTLQEYILIAQDQRAIEQYTRGDDGRWHWVEEQDVQEPITLTSIGCTLALTDVYAKVTF